VDVLWWALVGIGAALLVALLLLAVLFLWLGRTEDARALAGFVPDCIVLFTRLVRDPRVSLARKVLLVLMVAYLATPIDLIPGSALDDALLAAVVLRMVLRGSGTLVEEHWPGPRSSLNVLLRLAGEPPSNEAQPPGRPGERKTAGPSTRGESG
jgi:uncharacterized membrane protein YkvA (DUF1232 family)